MKEFLKNKYNIIIPVLLIIVLLIAVSLYVGEYKNNRYAKVQKTEVYQYFASVKMEYEANISRNKKDVILDYDPGDFAVELSSTPVYYKDSNRVIFPKEMALFDPLKDRAYKVNALGEIYEENNLYYLNTKDVKKTFGHVFYYDGDNLYFFVDTVTLKIGNREIILGPLSYVSASYRSLVEYYDKSTDTSEILELTNEDVIVENDFMKIDVGSDKVIYKDNFTLLAKDFSVLPKVDEMDK